MDAFVVRYLGVKSGGKHIPLPRRRNQPRVTREHLRAATHGGDVGRADEGHLDIHHPREFAARDEARELTAIAVAAHGNIHRREVAALVVFDLLREQDHPGAGPPDRQPLHHHHAHRLKEAKLTQQFALRRALPAGKDQRVKPLKIRPFAYLDGLRADAREHRAVFGKGSLHRADTDAFHYFPRSAISTAISFSLMPTIAPPRSSDISASILGSS